jgi:glutathione reductase (NADPH)
MLEYEFDLLVVGGGSGGVAAARRAAEHGARVAICEDHQWGGTCVHRGCVPKKLLVYSSQFGAARKLMPAYGWSAPGGPVDWAKLKANLHKELERLHGFYQRILTESRVEKLAGTGLIKGPHTVEVEGRSYTAKTILLAMGGKPLKPPKLEGAELGLTSDDMFWLEKLPQDILVVGSGYIGTEFAGILNGLGVAVHQSFGSDHLLPEFDKDIRLTVEEEMEKQGVTFHRQKRPNKLQKLDSGRLQVHFDQGESLQVDQVLLATGRTPRTADIGLDQVGVRLGKDGQVLTNAFFQSSVPSIYAIGDCTKRFELTPVAIAEGRSLAEHLYNGKPLDFHYDRLATAVFSTPPAGTVGFSEDQLRKKGASFDIYRAKFRPMKYSLPAGNAQAMLKLLVDPKTDRVLGCHLVGEESPELIQVLAVALKAKATKATFDSTIAVHPTFSEELVLLRKPSESVEGPNPTPDFDDGATIDTLAES